MTTDHELLSAVERLRDAPVHHREFLTIRETDRITIFAGLSRLQSLLGGGWLPISTAPKGRKVIVCYKNILGNWRTVIAKYYDNKTLLREDSEYSDDEEAYADEGWYEVTETHETVLPVEMPPTHWMPLPLKPTGEL